MHIRNLAENAKRGWPFGQPLNVLVELIRIELTTS